MFKHILVPLDGSKEAERVVGIAAGLARTFGARITLLGVAESSVEVDGRQRTPREREHLELFKKQLAEARAAFKKYLDGVQKRLDKYRVKSAVAVEDGRPSEEIVKAARDRGADLILLLSRCDAELAPGILGSVTDRVLRSSTIPLLIASPDMQIPDDSLMVRHVLVPIDLSQISSKAIPVAVSIGKAFHAELRFLRVTPQVFYPGMAIGSPYASNVALGGAVRDEALKALEGILGDARKQGVKAEGQAGTGSPATVIIQVAASLDDCIIVMSTHGLGGLQRMVLGSVTDKVVRGTGRPVLVIPPA